MTHYFLSTLVNDLTKVLTPGQYQGYLASKEQMRRQVIEKVMEKRNSGG